jgi:hypothetical protein
VLVAAPPKTPACELDRAEPASYLSAVHRTGLAAGVILFTTTSVLLAGANCHDGPPETSGAGGGQPDAGSCGMGPHPSFTLEITAADGPVPMDTQIAVKWSAGEEPVFMLSDASTWKTLETANIACSVDPKAPPPTNLMTLSCELWTSGATEIRITAKGYTTSDKTYTQMTSDRCTMPLLTDIKVKLDRVLDGGS